MSTMLIYAENLIKENNYADAYKIYESLAMLNEPFPAESKCAEYQAEAQYQCGLMRRDGHEGIEQDIDKAFEFFTDAMNSGFSPKASIALRDIGNEINDLHEVNINQKNQQQESQTDINQSNVRNTKLPIGTYLTPNIPLRTNGVFAFSGFISNTKISTNPVEIQNLITDGTLVRRPVHASDIAGNVSNYTLQENGFEVRHVPETSLKSLTLLRDPSNQQARAELRSSMCHNIQSLARNLGYSENVKVVALDSVIRDTNTTSQSAFRQVNLFHADFPPGKFNETLDNFSDTWKPRFAANGIDLNKYEIVKLVNVWMPLDEQVVADPLALIDQNDVQPGSMEQYTAVRRDNSTFHAMVLKSNSTQDNVKYLSSIKLGECYVFDSTNTPHSSIPIEGQSPDGRRSVEVRFAVLEPKHPIKPD